MIIPKNIFQTHKSLKYALSKQKIKNAINSWTKHKDFNYTFYDDEMCDEFVKQYFDDDVYKAYNKCPLAVMKADLWRYCIIYQFGGIYADTDAVCMQTPHTFIVNDALLVCAPENGNNFFCQWTFSAPPKSPVLKKIIDLSVQRILEMDVIKGEHIIHHLTGPAVFTTAIFEYTNENDGNNFNHVTQYINYPYPTIFVFENKHFHSHIIRHLYAGSDMDGWMRERDQKLKY